MFFTPSWLAEETESPPPQEVIDKLYHWYALGVILLGTAVLRIVTLDLVGGILSALMFCMVWMMLSDGMKAMPRYAFVFGILCMLCMFFDLVPLLVSLDGRCEVSYQPVSHEHTSTGSSTVYTAVVKTTPLFDWSQGFTYNATSVSMILSPLTMLFGAYLSFHAQVSIQRASGPLWDEVDWWTGRLPADVGAADEGAAAAGGAAQRHLRSIGRFQGRGRRLESSGHSRTPPSEEGGQKIPGLYAPETPPSTRAKAGPAEAEERM
mmetsp:Transcript_72977/g.190374  ORF Transcript_72977/g.190374 Transcript_72977/m.190374 type:complete len:264 (+) Transcript_72977:119-910(+)